MLVVIFICNFATQQYYETTTPAYDNTPTPQHHNTKNMTTEDRADLKQKIEEQITETITKIEELEELCQPIAPDVSLGRITRMDAINNKSVAEASLRSTKRKLGKLQHALSKIDSPDLGICAVCKRPIQPKRIILMPESSRCVRCASR